MTPFYLLYAKSVTLPTIYTIICNQKETKAIQSYVNGNITRDTSFTVESLAVFCIGLDSGIAEQCCQ